MRRLVDTVDTPLGSDLFICPDVDFDWGGRKLCLCYVCVCVWGVWENPDDIARAVMFPQHNINSLLVWGDGGQAGALKGGSHLHTTAHSCPPGPAKAPGRLTGCVYTHASFLLLPLTPILLSPVSSPLFQLFSSSGTPWLRSGPTSRLVAQVTRAC